MIPQNITREHIRQAAAQIYEQGVPPERESKKYDVIVDEKRFPPKYVISKANEYANGEELQPFVFIASEALKFLDRLGFRITLKRQP